MSPEKKSQFEQTKAEISLSPIRGGFWSRVRGYFFAGVLVTAPISLTLYLAWAFINFIDTRVHRLIPPEYNPETYLPFSLPGLGLIITILFLVLVGFLTANFLGRYFIRLSEAILNRMPVIRSVYSATKQIMETVFASQSQAFREVVLLEYPRREMWVIGFLTGPTKEEVQRKTNEKMLNVFVPTTPNPTSGFLIFVPEDDITRLNMTVEEGIKMVVSAGIVTPPDVKKAPEA